MIYRLYHVTQRSDLIFEEFKCLFRAVEAWNNAMYPIILEMVELATNRATLLARYDEKDLLTS